MSAIDLVKHQYASMTDGQLVYLAKGSDDLTYEAFLILKKEFRKRNLDKEIIKKAEENRVQLKKDKIKSYLEKELLNNVSQILRTVINGKLSSTPNAEIQEQLMELGLDYEQSSEVISNLRPTSEHLLKY